MRIVVNIVGVVLVLLGSIWILQGINVLARQLHERANALGGARRDSSCRRDRWFVWANRKRKSAA